MSNWSPSETSGFSVEKKVTPEGARMCGKHRGYFQQFWKCGNDWSYGRNFRMCGN